MGFPGIQYVIDAAKVDISPILPFFKSVKWKKIFFNGKFDEQFMMHYYNTPILNVFDCLIAERVIAPESKWGNSFEDLALQYLNVQLDKKVRQSFFGKKSGNYTQDQIKYAAEDVEYLFPLYEMQLEKLKTLEMMHIADLEFDLITVVASMELEGVPINPVMWRDILKEYEKEHAEARKTALTAFTGIDEFDQQLGFFGDGPELLHGRKLNLGSPDQLKKAFAENGILLESTAAQYIERMDDPTAKALVEYRKLDKLVTSYGESSFLSKIHPFTGRIHANWQQIGTETGRFSCKQPNLQQIPPKLRACVGGESDWVLIGADFSQMELRILAELSKDPILVDAFMTGKDIHSVTASNLFNLDMDNISKEQRYAAKTLNFGITYGMKARKFMDMMNAEAIKAGKKEITIKQAGELIDKYRETYKTANNYLDATGWQSIRELKTQTPFGRKRFFKSVPTNIAAKAYKGQIEAIKRQGANMPIQGTNADITKMAMIELHEALRDYGYRGNIILQVHDEIVVLAHKTQAEHIKPMIVDTMVKAGQELLPNIPVVVDAYVSDYWQK